jgi:hypothetical protein
MKKIGGTLASFAVVVVVAGLAWTGTAVAGRGDTQYSYKVLQPIAHGNLTIFPVVAGNSHDTSAFITLDDGIKSGDVVITEAGRANPLVRRRHVMPPSSDSAQVNRLVLVNNSERPLILLAGEIVTGGKQDRVIGKDRLIPAQSDPVDLGVFCVEPGRWVARSDKFVPLASQMAAPSVRNRAMAEKDQTRVWDEVRKSNAEMAKAVPSAVEVGGMSSYAGVVDNREVKAQVDAVAAPLARSYESVRGELHKRNAVGVVVAVNGQIIWADVFASPALLDKYWPKLVRSYAAEAITTRSVRDGDAEADLSQAQRYLNEMAGYHEVTETEPGVFRYAESSAPGFKVFALTSLLPKTGFEIHLAKMRTSGRSGPELMEQPYMERMERPR